MDIWNNTLWLRIFGKAWKSISEVYPKIGAFAALHDKKEVLMDGNAQRMLGLSAGPDHREFCEMIKEVAEDQDENSPLRIKLLDTEENVLAGFLYINDESSEEINTDNYPISTQPQLIQKMTADSADSLIALINLEGADDPAHTSSCILSALNAISENLPERAVIASHSKLQFWIYIPDFKGNTAEMLAGLQKSVRECELTDEFGIVISAEHRMDITIGCCEENLGPAQKLHAANFALFDAQKNGEGSVCCYSPERYELQKNEFHSIKIFSKLIDQNLFIYHFQPIVSARTGDIVAYEALMRTDESIGLNPIQILEMGNRFGRLYDIEKATLYNTVAYLSSHQEAFDKRRLFVNVISSQILSEEDYGRLQRDYGELLEKIVIELTEQTELPDENLEFIHKRLKSSNMHLAIDDYGTGYSNTSNLLRYNPDIVKIDRSLISHIDSNLKMQNIVSGIIEFLHASGYIALAEGVETSEELRTMINFGADLIQGYYVSRPKPVLLHEISDNIKSEIIQMNLDSSENLQKIYRPSENETIDLEKIALEKYTSIFISVSEVTLVGNQDHTVPVTVTVKEETDCVIVLENANIISNSEDSCIRLGNGCNVTLLCTETNKIERKGIFVPRSSSLKIAGGGSLEINSEGQYGFAIGCSTSNSFGSITIELDGHLSVTVNGDKCVAIGGGKNPENNKIKILSGALSIKCFGIDCLGIGSFNGNSIIEMHSSRCSVYTGSTSAAAIGSFTGSCDIAMSDFDLECDQSGNAAVSIGSLRNGTGKIRLTDGSIKILLKGKDLGCIGTRGGSVDTFIKNTVINLYCEGGSVSGIGDIEGAGNIEIFDSELTVDFRTGSGHALGTRDGTLNLAHVRKSIMINE